MLKNIFFIDFSILYLYTVNIIILVRLAYTFK